MWAAAIDIDIDIFIGFFLLSRMQVVGARDIYVSSNL